MTEKNMNIAILSQGLLSRIGDSTPEKIANIWQIKRVGIRAMKFITARIRHFLGDSLAAIAVVVA